MRIARRFIPALAILLLPLHAFHPPFEGTNPDLEKIRVSVIQDLIAIPVNEAEVSGLVETLGEDGSWPDIDYTDLSRTGFDHQRHLARMFDLSRAFRQPGNRWYQHPAVKNAALSALDFWLENDFICENWWWNEMGTPSRMINTLLVLDGELNERQVREGLRIAGRAHLEASGARPGGDLIQIADMLGKQALFRRDATVLAQVVRVMTDEVKVTTGRGLKPDMSFHHRVDNVISTLSYGRGYANSFTYWAVKVAGTRYAFPDRAVELLVDYFLDGICKSMIHARYPDPGAKNRDLSRQGNLRPAGPALADRLLRVTDYRQEELETVAAIRRGERPSTLVSNRFFWHSEYLTHQRPRWFASVRMHSARNYTTEHPHNEEGLKNHHLGDGATFISRKGNEYYDIFPVWDWQKIPGTTVVQKPEHPHWRDIARKGLTEFVGGVSDGRYGVSAFDFKSAHDPLKARKAWFFFDDEFVCLGSRLSATADHPVLTTLNQTLLRGPVTARLRRDIQRLSKGKHVLFNAAWIHHDSVGYVFPRPETVYMTNIASVGRWREINHQSRTSSDTVRHDVFSLWFDHGVRPQNAEYAYIVVPGTSSEDIDMYSKNLPLTIIENSSDVQAVYHRTLRRTGAAFYSPGRVRTSDGLIVQAEEPCLVMAHGSGRTLVSLVVADPSRKLDSLHLRTNAFVQNTGEDWEARWDEKRKETRIAIDLPDDDYAGESVVLHILPQ